MFTSAGQPLGPSTAEKKSILDEQVNFIFISRKMLRNKITYKTEEFLGGNNELEAGGEDDSSLFVLFREKKENI